MSEHYFSDQPSGPEVRRMIRARLAGREVELITANGVFSADGLDTGTAVLLRLSPVPRGAMAICDLGCGYGPIALALATMPKPVIAAVNGVAAGAGASLAFAADFRIVVDSAGFNTSFAGVALSCDTGSSWTLPRLVGRAKAMELLYFPRTVTAREALELGLATQVVTAEELPQVVGELAARLASGPTVAFGSIRQAVAYAAAHPLEESLAFEADKMALTGGTEDNLAAVDAFMAKQTPVFRGR